MCAKEPNVTFFKTSAASVFSFDMEMHTLIMAGGPASPYRDPTALGDRLRLKVGKQNSSGLCFHFLPPPSV